MIELTRLNTTRKIDELALTEPQEATDPEESPRPQIETHATAPAPMFQQRGKQQQLHGLGFTHSLQAHVTLLHRLLDSTAVSLVGLVVGCVVLGLGHFLVPQRKISERGEWCDACHTRVSKLLRRRLLLV